MKCQEALWLMVRTCLVSCTWIGAIIMLELPITQ